jgi:DNA N-6-adenine-methyltransferase (Dam)
MSIGSHEKPNKGNTDTWLTPISIIKELGQFDTDPCVPEQMPYKTATKMITEKECGLKTPWVGRVFMNPPYSKNLEFSEKFKNHGNGIALVFARTETKWFQNYYCCDAFLFLKNRLHFCDINGTQAKGNSGAPSVLIAIGDNNVLSLKEYYNKKGGLFLTHFRD